MKTCKHCKEEKPDEAFRPNKSHRRQTCKKCEVRMRKEKRNGAGKLCVRCEERKSESRFSFQRNQDGKTYQRNICMDCTNLQQYERKARRAGKIKSATAKQEYFSNADQVQILAVNRRWA